MSESNPNIFDKWTQATLGVYAKKPTKKTEKNFGHKYAEAVDHHKRMEAELSRALNRWQKSRLALHRLEKKLDALNLHVNQD